MRSAGSVIAAVHLVARCAVSVEELMIPLLGQEAQAILSQRFAIGAAHAHFGVDQLIETVGRGCLEGP
ncbi:hypothetical protein QF002_001182 [Paraburkholderia youngii]